MSNVAGGDLRGWKTDGESAPVTRTGPQQICESIVVDVDGSLGCALVDLATGLPLAAAVRPASRVDETTLELLAAAGVSFFSDDRPVPAELPAGTDDYQHSAGSLRELQITTQDAYGFMSLVPGAEGQLLILVTDRGAAKLGLGWVGMRQALALLGGSGAGDGGHATETQAS